MWNNAAAHNDIFATAKAGRRKGKISMLLSYAHGDECYERHGQIEKRMPQ